MPRLAIQAALSSADQTQLEAVLELEVALAASELEDQVDMVGDLTTGIALAAALGMSVSLVSAFTSADPGAALGVTITLAGALTTGIALDAQLEVDTSLGARLRSELTGDYDTQSGPGDLWSASPASSANRATPEDTANRARPRMETGA